MVAPSPNLYRKMKNTENLIRAGKSQTAAMLAQSDPENYISIDEYDRLMKLKPWEQRPLQV